MSDSTSFERQQVDGVLLLDKPESISSNAALQISKRLLQAKRAGHTGTLDPMASGLLVICFGHATKFAAEMLAEKKAYVAEIVLGVRTSTADREGEIISQSDVAADDEKVVRTVHSFIGELEQTPPMYSALKMSGVPLYRYARQGIDVPRASRRVTIYKIEVMRIQHPVVEFSVTCSKGTYVRSLAEDIGAALGCGAYLSKLNRTEIGPFALRDSCTITGLEQSDLLTRRGFLRPTDCLLSRYPEITLDQDQVRSFSVGKPFKVIVARPGEVRVYGANKQFLGLAMVGLDGLAQPKRVLFQG